MSNYSTIRKVIVATAVASALALTSLAGGAVSADGPSLNGTQGTEKKPGRTTFANIVLERGALDDGSIPTETLSLNFDKIPSTQRP